MIEVSSSLYHTCDYNYYMEFNDLSSKIFYANLATKKGITDEMINFKKSMADEIIKILTERENNLLEAILYLYSVDFIYSDYNSAFQRQELHRVILTISFCYHEAMNLKKYHFTGDYLFRRWSTLDYSQFKEYLKNKQPLFLPGFTSTFNNQEAASALLSWGVILKIRLSKTHPHPHICLEKSWSQYPQADEVLLMTYTPLVVAEINKLEGIIVLHQLDKIELKFKYLDQEEFKLSIDAFASIKDLKKIVKKKLNLQIKNQVLMFHSNALENSNTIAYYNLADGDAIDIILNI